MSLFVSKMFVLFCLLVGPLLCAVAILVAYYFQDKITQEEKELAAKFVESVLAGEWKVTP